MATMEVISSCIAPPQLDQTLVKLLLANLDFFSFSFFSLFFFFFFPLTDIWRWWSIPLSAVIFPCIVRWRSKCTSAGSSGWFARLDGWHHRHGNSRAIGTARMANSTSECPLVYASAYPHKGPDEPRSRAKRCKWSLWSVLRLKTLHTKRSWKISKCRRPSELVQFQRPSLARSWINGCIVLEVSKVATRRRQRLWLLQNFRSVLWKGRQCCLKVE